MPKPMSNNDLNKYLPVKSLEITKGTTLPLAIPLFLVPGAGIEPAR
jgi:hypothetical protein